MSQGIEISLRGAGAWKGLTYESEIHPTTGRFRKLQGFQASRDGSELVRVPGMALVAEPGYADGVYEGNLTGGATTRFEAGVGLGPYNGALMQEDAGANTFAYLRKNAASPNDLPDGWHRGIQPVAAGEERMFDTSILSTGTSTGDKDELWLFRAGKRDNLRPLHGIIECLGLPVLVFESDVYFDATKAATPVDAYGVGLNQHMQGLSGKRRFDFDSVMHPPDFHVWRSVLHQSLIADIQYARDTDNGYEGASELQYNTKRVPRKVQLEVYDGRVIIAAPGYGCMFEMSLKHGMNLVDSGSMSPGGPLQSLGVPKGCFSGNISFTPAGTGEIQNGVTVYARVACFNRTTGEIGLVSELLEGTSGGAGPYFGSVDVLIPRWVLRETHADAIYLFTSSFDITGSPAVLHLERISTVGSSIPVAAVTFGGSTFPDVPDFDGTRAAPRLPQMPEGSIWARTLKGHLFTGGKIGREGLADMSMETLRALDNNSSWECKEPFLVSGKGIPPAYQGVLAGVQASPPTTTRLIHLRNITTAAPYRMFWNYEGHTGGASTTVQRAILLDKSHVSFSPKERPGEAPETNRIIADRIHGRDVVACGRFRNRLIVCTDSETYGISWGVSPIGVDPQLLHSTYGCISPDSMVETDIGLFWLSHRGPVFFDGATVKWVGAPVEPRFQRDWRDPAGVLRDKRFLFCDSGLMWNARGVFDPVRRTVQWFLRTDEHATTFADAGRVFAINSVTAADPAVVTLAPAPELRLQLFQKIQALVENDTERATMNGSYDDVEVLSLTELTMRGFDNTGGSTGTSGQIRIDIDAEQSKVGADEALTLQIDSMAFSTRKFESDRLWTGVAACEFADGIRRTVVVSSEKQTLGDARDAELHGSIFGIDDKYADRLQAPVSVAATEGPIADGSDLYLKALGTDFRDLLRFQGVASPWPCNYAAFIRSGTVRADGLYDLKWWGTIDQVRQVTTVDQVRIVNGGGITATPTWVAGDVIEIGVIHAELETTLMNLADLAESGLQDSHELRGITLEHTFRKEHNPASDPIVAWAFVEGYAQSAWTLLHPETWGHPLVATQEGSRVFGGAVLGRETALRMTLISNARAHLKDIRLEMRER